MKRTSKAYKMFIAKFKHSKWHKAYSNDYKDWWTYGTNSGKFGISFVMRDILNDEFDLRQKGLMFSIIGIAEKSVHFEKAALVYLRAVDFEKDCNRKFFKTTIDKFVDNGFLIRTPESKYFILSPHHVNMFSRKMEYK